MSRLERLGQTASHGALLLLVAASGWTACRYGGSRDPVLPPPRADAPAASSNHAPTIAAAPPSPSGDAGAAATGAQGPSGSSAYGVTARFVELVKDARYDVPKQREGLIALAAHWRKMNVPWLGLPAAIAPRVTSIAVRASASEVQWTTPASSGKTWTPDARVWNMNEGSFDQREALFAPPPGVVSFNVTVPPGGALSFSPLVLNPASNAAVAFQISVVDGQGAEHEVYAQRFGAAESRRWNDATADLSRFAGQRVELRWKTQLESPTDGKPLAATSGLPLALWGTPTLLGRNAELPYNLLWIVVDALRPDVIASFHDDAEDSAKLRAKFPPLDALLPKVPGLMPSIDALAADSVFFRHAYSAAPWTRPGTIAMLAGARSSEVGISPLNWVLTDAAVQRYYRTDTPLLPLVLRKHGVATRAFVNNFFMIGYAAVGVDMGFERILDHRYRTKDTAEITKDAIAWLDANKEQRFFVFCNYNSPHDPYEPPETFKKRVPGPPDGPKDAAIRLYMAEAAKDDEAIGDLVKALERLELRKNTLIVITADHGETLSSAHAGTSQLDHMPIRYHHAVSNFEETTHVPIVLSLPGVLDARSVDARVRNTDIAPTVLDLERIEAHPRMSGQSLVTLARGGKEADERVIVTEGRGTKTILWGKYRLIVREGAAMTTYYGEQAVVSQEELFDLEDDPGERHNLAHDRRELVAELRARLDAAMKNEPAADAKLPATQAMAPTPGKGPAAPQADRSTIRLRFAGGGEPRRVVGTVTVTSPQGTAAPVVNVSPVLVGKEAIRRNGSTFELAFLTARDAIVGVDLHVEPPQALLAWKFFLDDKPWPTERVFAGPFGIAAPRLRDGIGNDDARNEAYSPRVPEVDPVRDLGLFVTRDRGASAAAPVRNLSAQGADEMNRLLQQWGYAHGSGGGKK